MSIESRAFLTFFSVHLLAGAAAAAPADGGRPIAPDLKALAAGTGGTLSPGASARWLPDVKGRPALHLSAGDNGALLRLDGVAFTNGVIEFDALGRSAPPQSTFVGIAFRVAGENMADVVFFRPFNFRADSALSRAHSLQYMSLPDYSWKVLRERHPGRYETDIAPAPDGDAWVHARIVVDKPRVSVYVDGAREPSLVVDEISPRNGGGVALFVATEQGGHFANLTITPAGRAAD